MGGILVFVYGSLKRGFYNHGLLENSEFISEYKTGANFTLLDLIAYPAVLNEGTTSIKGEIYRVNENTFKQLDQLEGYPRFYDRIVIETKMGNAWMYILQENKNHPVIESGEWVQ